MTKQITTLKALLAVSAVLCVVFAVFMLNLSSFVDSDNEQIAGAIIVWALLAVFHLPSWVLGVIINTTMLLILILDKKTELRKILLACVILLTITTVFMIISTVVNSMVTMYSPLLLGANLAAMLVYAATWICAICVYVKVKKTPNTTDETESAML